MRLQCEVITRRAETNTSVNNISGYRERGTAPGVPPSDPESRGVYPHTGGEGGSDHALFLAFEYGRTSNRQKTLDEIAEGLSRAAWRIRAGPARCGNELIDPSELSNLACAQAEILCTIYNRRSCVREEFTDRGNRVTADPMRMMGLREGVDPCPDIPIADCIARRGVDFSHPDSCVCDGIYTAVLLIRASGYPVSVCAGWMSALTGSGDGMDADSFRRKENRAAAKEKVALRMKLNRIKVNSRSDIDMDFETLNDAIQSASYTRSMLSGGEDLCPMCPFLSVSAEALEDLNLRLERGKDNLYAQDIETRRIKWRLQDAFQVISPVLACRKGLYDFATRNVMTGGAAGTSLMTSAEICDDCGIVMGANTRYQSPVNMDIFHTKRYKNANITIVGTSGAGRTCTELLMALRMRMRMPGIQTFLLSPDRAHEFRRACARAGGSYPEFPAKRDIIFRKTLFFRPTIRLLVI